MAFKPQSLSTARDEFSSARRRAALEEIFSRLAGKSPELLSFDDVYQKLRGEPGVQAGVQEIRLDAIVGSAGRYSDFTRTFLPLQDSDEQRWAGVQLAMTGSTPWPPIDVYQIGEAYFVLDGNHRVSVARRLGHTHIAAHVTTIKTRVPLTPNVQPDDLIAKAEYAEFLETTKLDQLCPGADLSVTVPGQYRRFEDLIEVHRYFREVEQEREIPFDEAVCLWYQEGYLPIVEVMREQGMLAAFPGRTEADLYIFIVQHRLQLQRKLGLRISDESAAAHLAQQFGPRLRRSLAKWRSRIRRVLLRRSRPRSR